MWSQSQGNLPRPTFAVVDGSCDGRSINGLQLTEVRSGTPGSTYNLLPLSFDVEKSVKCRTIFGSRTLGYLYATKPAELSLLLWLQGFNPTRRGCVSICSIYPGSVFHSTTFRISNTLEIKFLEVVTTLSP